PPGVADVAIIVNGGNLGTTGRRGKRYSSVIPSQEWTLPDAMSRRHFIGAAGAGLAVAATPGLAFSLGAPAVRRSAVATPAAVSSANGLRAVDRAIELVLQGSDTL